MRCIGRVSAIKGGKKHGEGTETFVSGDKYVGQYKDSKRDGEGTWTFADGGKYDGQFKDDKMHGLGKYTRANGTVLHDGEFENGLPKK